MDILKGMIGPVAKAAAGALVPVVLFLVGWLAEKVGVPIDIDPQKLSQWIFTAIAAVGTYGAVWWTKNHPAEEPTQ